MDDFLEILQASLPEIIGGLILAAILAAVAAVYNKHGQLHALWRRLFRRKCVEIDRTTQVVVQPFLDHSELLGRFQFTRERVIARVHEEYEPVYSDDIRSAFDELNVKKRSKGLNGYYPGPRFRPIAPPKISSINLELDLSPLNYAFVALMKDEEADSFTKQRVREALSKVREPLSAGLRSDHPHFNVHSYNILGTEICLMASDGFTLLRKRGKHVLTGKRRWDVSASGHPVPYDVTHDQLDLTRTVQREVEDEIGGISGDPRRIIFTGLHRNKTSGDIDLLAFWPIDDSAERLGKLITEKYPDQRTRIFKTTRRARESYVWDTDNLIIEFDGHIILQALQDEGVSLEDFVPEALACLELALMAHDRPTLGLALS